MSLKKSEKTSQMSDIKSGTSRNKMSRLVESDSESSGKKTRHFCQMIPLCPVLRMVQPDTAVGDG